MDRVDAVVVGAGAVGLAVARALALQGRETLVLEAEAGIGNGISSRNSEVIHAGIYDAPGSLKAQLCVAGRRLLYPYCEAHGVGHRRCGKLVVAAATAQVEMLRTIERRAAGNGVEGLRWLGGAEARALEPALQAEAALLSTATGIIDSHALMLAYLGDLENAGGALVLRSPLESALVCNPGFVLRVGGDAPLEIEARLLVNAAGLHAPALARRIDGLDPAHVPRAWFAKGNYFALAGRSPFTRLIYPVPEPGGLGVHLTLDLAGQARFGPDVEWLADESPDAIDYAVDPTRSAAFYAAIRRYWPGLKEGALTPAYSGVRPKLQGPGEPVRDFMLQGPEAHGVVGLLNLFGIESPGLTASLAIAAEAVGRLGVRVDRKTPSIGSVPGASSDRRGRRVRSARSRSGRRATGMGPPSIGGRRPTMPRLTLFPPLSLSWSFAMSRVINFSAGPAVLPESVLRQAAEEMLDWHGSGMSVMEMSHRGKEFIAIHAEAESLLRELMAIPTSYKVLFMQGGAIGENAIVPMNMLRGKTGADYIHTGEWSKKSIAEAKKYAKINVAASAEASRFTSVPARDGWQLDADAAYVHICANETIGGVEYHFTPDTGAVPLVADMSSNILSRPVDVSRYGLIYGGAQKNIGPAGLTIVIVREDLIGQAHPLTPSAFDYKQQADNDSMLNTPPTYAIYIAGLVFRWIKARGGLAAMAEHNRVKAALLYDHLDRSAFYSNPVARSDRSLMNVPFRLKDEALDDAFLKGAQARGMVQLKGHRSVGGMRASIYNAMPIEGVQALVDYMKEFEARHG